MKVIIAFAAVCAVVIAAPSSQNPEASAQIVRQESDNIGVDGYNFSYETSNGIGQQESAQLKNAGTEDEALSVQGSYYYTGADGVQYQVIYIADENGFQPQGAHIPQAAAPQ